MSKQNIGRNLSNPIKEKSFDFALEIVNLYKELKVKQEYVLSKQLLRSGTSIGANVEEALAGISRKDFIAKMSIASKEARETKYWLRILEHSSLVDIEMSNYHNHIDELIRLLTSIVKTSQEKSISI